jgi:hypothetical protein
VRVRAYNLGNFLHRLELGARVMYWTLTTLREKLVKIGANMVPHARHVTAQLTKVAIARQLYRTILDWICHFSEIRPRVAAGRSVP